MEVVVINELFQLEQDQPDFENSPLEKCKNLWSMLPSPERNHLCQLIGFIDNDTHATCHYIGKHIILIIPFDDKCILID